MIIFQDPIATVEFLAAIATLIAIIKVSLTDPQASRKEIGTRISATRNSSMGGMFDVGSFRTYKQFLAH